MPGALGEAPWRYAVKTVDGGPMTEHSVSPVGVLLLPGFRSSRPVQLILCWAGVREAYSQILSFGGESKRHTDNHCLIQSMFIKHLLYWC